MTAVHNCAAACRSRRGDPPAATVRRASLVELRGLEPLTPCMPCRCATSCATAPIGWCHPVTGQRRGILANRVTTGEIAPGGMVGMHPHADGLVVGHQAKVALLRVLAEHGPAAVLHPPHRPGDLPGPSQERGEAVLEAR